MRKARRPERNSLKSPRHCSTDLPGIRILYLVFLLGLLLRSEAPAYDLSLHGFLEGNYSANTAGNNPDGKDFKWSQERIQIRLEALQEQFRLFVREDLFYDNLDRDTGTELREGFVDYTGGAWDARAGRQIITWGVGDLVFVNDVFPKDYNAFFAGRPPDYMKKGVDGVRVGVYPGFVSIEFIAMPIFEPDTLPDARRFRMSDPFSDITNRCEKKPASTPENTEIALRLYRDVAGFDASVYAYKGYFRQPSARPDDPGAPTSLTLFYPKLAVYGASLQGRALDGVASLEAGYYDSKEDRPGHDPMVPNSRSKYLAGYQKQLWEDFTLGLQYYGEYMHDYSAYLNSLPAGVARERRQRNLLTVRLTQLLLHQTLRLSLYCLYSPSDADSLLNLEVKYNFSDHIWAAAGANKFDGNKPWTQFGQLSRDDNVYLQMRYEL